MADRPSRNSAAAGQGKPTPVDLTIQLRRCMSEILTGWTPQDFGTKDSLEGKFKIDGYGRRDLADKLNDCFARHGKSLPKRLVEDQTGDAETVGDLDALVLESFGYK